MGEQIMTTRTCIRLSASIAFIACFIGYLEHTLEHFFEHRGKELKINHIILHIFIFASYFGWGYMLFSDPVKVDFGIAVKITGAILTILGGTIGILGITEKKNFQKENKLLTTGIYSKVRHPMYVGLISLHVFLPSVTGSVITLASAAIWTSHMLLWMKWENEDLEKRFGKKYSEYKKKTWF